MPGLASVKRRLASGLSQDQREFVAGLGRRRAGLITASPARALKAATRAGPAERLQEMRTRAMSDARLSVHSDAISYPLRPVDRPDKPGGYLCGGLASASGNLITEAIHYNGVERCQSLPHSELVRHPFDRLIEIERPVVFGGILYAHFGHFLAESIGRLYAYPVLRDLDPFVLFHIPAGQPRYLERDNFVNQVLTGFRIPPERLLVHQAPVRLRQIVVPRQDYGYGFLHDPDPGFVEFIRTFEFEPRLPRGFERAQEVYVSRAALRRRGSQIGEERFSRFLQTQGYAVFHPERHTLAEQLTVYTRARKIIFSEGSAILACILLPDLTAEVAVIGRRRDPTREIRVSLDCLSGYGKSMLWIDAVLAQYQFGLDSYDAMAEIDWRAVGTRLHRNGFTRQPYEGIPRDELETLVRDELTEYLIEIAAHPRFVTHMVDLAERHPRWCGESHLIDPRNGRPITAAAGGEQARLTA